MLISITGACGNIGSHAMAEALRQGHTVRGFDLDTPANRSIQAEKFPEAEMVWGDISHLADVEKAVSSTDAVIHLCALIPFGGHSGIDPSINRKAGVRVNLQGTANIIAAAEKLAPASRLIFASSGAVYGIGDEVRRVGNPLRPGDDVYARQKIIDEMLVTTCDLDWTVLRLASGAMDPQKLSEPGLNFFAYRALDTKCEYAAVDDIALAFVNAAACSGTSRKILNIGGGPAMQTTHEDYCRRMCRFFGIEFPPKEIFPTKGQGAWADTEESQRLLNYQRHTLNDVFRK